MAENRNTSFPPSVNVGRLYERTSASGNRYLTGFFGTMKITALKSKDADAEGNPIWNLMIAAAPSRDKAGTGARAAPRNADQAADRADGRPPLQSNFPIGRDAGDEIPF